MCENVNETAVDGTRTTHDTVTIKVLLLHTEVVATVELEHIHFFERPFVEQQINAFARCSFALGMLFLDGFFATAEACLLATLNEVFDFL